MNETDHAKLVLATRILQWWFAEELADNPDDVREFDCGDFVDDIGMAIESLRLTAKDVR